MRCPLWVWSGSAVAQRARQAASDRSIDWSGQNADDETLWLSPQSRCTTARWAGRTAASARTPARSTAASGVPSTRPACTRSCARLASRAPRTPTTWSAPTPRSQTWVAAAAGVVDAGGGVCVGTECEDEMNLAGAAAATEAPFTRWLHFFFVKPPIFGNNRNNKIFYRCQRNLSL